MLRHRMLAGAVLSWAVGLVFAGEPPAELQPLPKLVVTPEQARRVIELWKEQRKAPPQSKPDDKPADVGWEVRTADGQFHKVTPSEKELTLETKFGTVKVPMAEVKRVEFGLRPTAAQQKKLTDAMADLTGGTGRTREAAKDSLLELGLLAYPAVTRAIKTAPKDAIPHLTLVQDKLKRQIGEDYDPPADADVLLTADGSKLVGRLVPEAVRVKFATGEKAVTWADTRVLAFGDQLVEEKVEIVNVGQFGVYGLIQTHLDKVVGVEVTGVGQGSVWGSNPYTADSTLGAAAVHAGVLKVGETGVVKIRVKADVGGYAGSTKNGVTTGNWGPFQGCYEVIGKSKKKK